MNKKYIDCDKKIYSQYKYIVTQKGYKISNSIQLLLNNKIKLGFEYLNIISVISDSRCRVVVSLEKGECEYIKNLSILNNKTQNDILSSLIYEYLYCIEILEPAIYKDSIINYEKESNIIKPTRNLKKDEYDNFIYNDRELDLINNTILSEEDIVAIKSIENKLKGSKNFIISKELYIFHKNGYTPQEISDIYGKNYRTFQLLLKEVGLNRNRWQAQAIASTKRNYKEIQLKGRQTMVKNQTNIKGSSQEQYIRELLNCTLPMEFPNLEIIVGLNNKSILENGKEIDIPIIIINKNNIIKLAIEYDGSFWHQDIEEDKYKDNIINEKGYELFRISPKGQATLKQIRETIDFEIDKLIGYLREKINNVT